MARSALIIDDDRDICALILDTLTMEGYSASAVYSGEDGAACAIAFPPDLILLDLWLPGWDGIETRRQLLAHSRTAAIPVVLMTAAGNSRKWQEDMQAQGRLDKPFGIRELIRTVKAVIGPP